MYRLQNARDGRHKSVGEFSSSVVDLDVPVLRPAAFHAVPTSLESGYFPPNAPPKHFNLAITI